MFEKSGEADVNIMQKDHGEVVSDMAVLLLTIIGSFCLIFTGIYFLRFSETRNNINMAMRSAILQMEETGYLEDGVKNQLATRLKSIGVTQIGNSNKVPEVTGTGESDLERPKLTLTVDGEMSMRVLSNAALGNGEDSWFNNITIPIHMTQESVAVGFITE